jgi:hypothetical protein
MTLFVGNSTVNSYIESTNARIGANSTFTILTANATGVYSNSTLVANSTGPYGKTEGNLNVNSALTANNSTNLGGTAAASYQLNSTLNANIASYLPTYTGVVNGSSHTVGTSTIANSTGVYTGVVNGSSITVGTAFTANATVVNAGSFYVGFTLIGNNTGPYGKLESNLNVNSALTANNSTNLGGQAAAYYTNATNISTGTLSAARGGTNSSLTPVSGGVVYSNATGMAITSAGTNTFVLASNGTVPAFTQIDMAYLPEATFKKSCRAATTADLSAASATTQVLTGGLVALPAQDGITLALNDRLLVKNQTSANQNGIYYVSNTGSAAVYAWTLTRANDANTSSKIASALVAVDEGTTNGGRLFDNDFKTTDTIGTTAMVWAANFDAGGGTITGVTTFNANIVLGSSGLSSNGGFGTAGQVLHSNGTATYWGVDDNSGTVTSVGTGNGLTGGAITTTGTVSVLANSGITANTTGLFVTQGTGTVVNATGVHVNATYIGTLSANNASFLGGTAAASYQLNSTLNANIAAYLPVYTGVVNGSSYTVSTSFIANATGVYHTGTMNAASHTVGTSTIANSTGVYTGIINAASHTVGSNFIANSTFGVQVQSGALTANTARNAGITFWTDRGFGAELHYGDTGSLQSTAWATALYGRKSDTVAVRIGAYPASNTSQNTFSEYITVLNSGNVGIGTTTPDGRLAVTGGRTLLRPSNEAYALGLFYGTSVNPVYLGSPAANSFQISRAGGDSVFNIDGNGNTGIGNTAPAHKLSVNGTTFLGGNLVISTTAGISANGGLGTAGQVLHSNGSAVYWAADDNSGGTVTSVAGGTGLSGGTITTTGTLSVNASYIATITANNATFAFGLSAASTTATGSTVVTRDANGDFNGRYINASYHNSSDDVSTGTLTYLMGKFGDNYHRSATAAKVATFISGQTMNIAGNATTATGAQGSSFATATTASEGQLLANFTGQSAAYLFNNGTAWGLYSASGGGIISYSRTNARCDLSAAYTQAAGSMRAPYFYDSDNTAYYCDPAGATGLNTLGNIQFNNGRKGLIGVYDPAHLIY